MQNIIFLANKQFTDEMSLCTVLVCSLHFTAMAPCHLHPTGASSVLDSEFITGSSLQKLYVSHFSPRTRLDPWCESQRLLNYAYRDL